MICGLSGLNHMPWLSPCGVRHGRERLAAVGGLVQAELVHPHLVLVLRVDVDVVEVERPRAQALAAVDQRPRLAGVVRAVEAALGARRLDHRVEHLRVAARDVDVDLADELLRQAGRDLLPRLAAVGGLVDAALGGRAAADDVPALAEAAVHAPRRGSSGFSQSTSMSRPPVSLFTKSVFFQVLPPSVVLKMPRSSLGPNGEPSAASHTMLGL